MIPNYIDIIRWYWDEVPEREGFKADYTSLFFALLDSINRNDWEETEIEYDRIMYKCPINKRTYLDGRKWLRDNNIISLKEGRGDYAKARFSVHDAVLSEVQKRTAKRTAKRTSCNTAPSTTESTANAPHPTPHFAPNISKPIKPLKPLNLEDVEDEAKTTSATEKKEDLPVWAIEEKERFAAEVAAFKNPPPVAVAPPLVREDYRKHLLAMTSAREQMGRSLKMYSDQEYEELINRFLTEQLDDGKTWKDLFDCGKHFRSWIPFVSFKTKSKNAGDSGAEQGKPNYEDVLNVVNERYFGEASRY